MAVNRLENAKPAGGNPGGGAGETKSAEIPQSAPSVAAAPHASNKGWILLGANVVVMPVLAWALTTYVLVPKFQSGAQGSEEGGAASEKPAAQSEKTAAHSSGGGVSKGGKEGAGRGKALVPLSSKVLVNVAGTMGTRYLLATMTLGGAAADLRSRVEENDAQLRDAAASVLAGKTIADLERPGARNLIRAELISAFNNLLGEGTVSELYLTDFAVQ